MHVCTWPVTFHSPLPLTDRRGVGSDGRDHYITKHPAAIVLSNCHTTLPQYCPQTTGQVLCATAQTQKEGEREGEVEKRERESQEKDRGKRGNERSKSKRKLRERGRLSPGSKSQLFSSRNTWHLYFHDPDNVCLVIEGLHKVKGQGSMVDVRLVIATAELSLITREAWHFCLHVMAINSPRPQGGFYTNMTPLLAQRRTSPLCLYCSHTKILLSMLSTFVAPQGAGATQTTLRTHSVKKTNHHVLPCTL